MTAITVESDDIPVCSLSILLEGNAISRLGSQRPREMRIGQDVALWGTGGRNHSTTADVINELDLLPDMARLRRVAATMLGDMEDVSFHPYCRDSKPVKLQAHGVDFGQMILKILANFDAVNLDPVTLARLGMDDAIYRCLVMMLAPDLFLSTPKRRPLNAGKRTLDMVQEYVAANLGQSIALSDLEAVSQLSQRALQYAFLKAHGCTPMAWVRQQRLHKAREHLRRAAPGMTVLKVALECGFVNPSTFAMYYRKQFGELPSTTLMHGKQM